MLATALVPRPRRSTCSAVGVPRKPRVADSWSWRVGRVFGLLTLVGTQVAGQATRLSDDEVVGTGRSRTGCATVRSASATPSSPELIDNAKETVSRARGQ